MYVTLQFPVLLRFMRACDNAAPQHLYADVHDTQSRFSDVPLHVSYLSNAKQTASAESRKCQKCALFKCLSWSLPWTGAGKTAAMTLSW